MNSLTPIKDIDHKIDIIDHVNQDHSEEVIAIASSYSGTKEIIHAKIVDLFNEGLKVHIKTLNGEEEIFIPFQIKGSLEDQILYLAYASIVKQGRSLSGSKQNFFEIIDSKKICKNIVRLEVKSLQPLPDDYAGYAYGFSLKSMTKAPKSLASDKKKNNHIKNIFDRIFIWVIKRLSPSNREKMIRNANKDIRLYTLRKAWKSSPSAKFLDCGYIDIFTHNQTKGSLWATTLKAGDIIMSRSASADKHKHLDNGHSVLIADETAWPALLGILENWNNPIPPIAVLMFKDAEDLNYFNEQSNRIAKQVAIHKINYGTENQISEVITLLSQISDIDNVWAACESESAKHIRRYLRNERGMTGQTNHTKAYWRNSK